MSWPLQHERCTARDELSYTINNEKIRYVNYKKITIIKNQYDWPSDPNSHFQQCDRLNCNTTLWLTSKQQLRNWFTRFFFITTLHYGQLKSSSPSHFLSHILHLMPTNEPTLLSGTQPHGQVLSNWFDTKPCHYRYHIINTRPTVWTPYQRNCHCHHLFRADNVQIISFYEPETYTIQ